MALSLDIHEDTKGVWLATHASNGAILGTGNSASDAMSNAIRQVIDAARKAEKSRDDIPAGQVLTVLLDEAYRD